MPDKLTPSDLESNDAQETAVSGSAQNSVEPSADLNSKSSGGRAPKGASSSDNKSTKIDKLPGGTTKSNRLEKTEVLLEEFSDSQSSPSSKTSNKGNKTTKCHNTTPINVSHLSLDQMETDVPSESKRKIKTVIGDAIDIIASSFGKGDAERTNFFTTIKNDHDDKEDSELLKKQQGNVTELSDVDKQYKFYEKIAEGGQGAIQKAVDKLFHRIVAVKSLHEEIKEKNEIRNSFIDEAEITAQLDHPSIVPIYGLYSDGKHGLHLAMKLINGQTLRKYLDTLTDQYESHIKANIAMREHKMLRQRLDVFLKICDAMTYAHSKHIIHRDLKPENIMIGRFNETYIMDWGIAMKMENGKPIQLQTISGTPRYIPPELLNKKPIDRRSDIYLLGLILFEVVFLKKAYPQHSTEDVLRAAKVGKTSSYTHAFGIKVDKDLKAIVAKALAPDPDNRYSSVARMAEDIRSYLNDEAVSVSPNPKISAIMRLMRRHSKFLFYIILILITFLFAGSVGTVFREINKQLEDDKIESALSHEFAQTLQTAHTIDAQFKNIAAHLQLFSEELAFRIKNPKSSTTLPVSAFYDYLAGRTIKTAPPAFHYHPNYTTFVSFNTFVYKTTKDTPQDSLALYLNCINSMLPPFESYMQTHGKGNTNHDFPILTLYAGFDSGLHVSYPYNTDYEDNYDPRLRPWYTCAQIADTDKPIWTKPYLNKTKIKQQIMTCTIPLKDAKGELIGVMGADVLPDTLEDILLANSEKSHILSKYVVTRDGEICAHINCHGGNTQGHYSPFISNKHIIFNLFPDMELFRKMWVMKNGRFSANKTASSIYIFAHLDSINMLYIEKINFIKMMESI